MSDEEKKQKAAAKRAKIIAFQEKEEMVMKAQNDASKIPKPGV